MYRVVSTKVEVADALECGGAGSVEKRRRYSQLRCLQIMMQEFENTDDIDGVLIEIEDIV